MLNFDELYLFTEDVKRTAVRVAFEGFLTFAQQLAIFHGHLEPKPPLQVREIKGAHPYDLITSSSVFLHLVSAGFRTALRDAGITGWDTLPVDTGSFELLRGYELLRVVGRCGPIDDAQSDRAIIPPTTPQGQAVDGWRGLYFDPSSYDGADVFGPPDTGEIFMTRKAVDVLRRLQPTNISFERLPSVVRFVI